MFDNEDRPHVKPGPIKYTKGFRTRRIVSKIINSIIILLIAAIVALAVFVFIKQPVNTNNGYVTAKPIYEMIEHGERIIVVEGDSHHLFTPLERFVIPQEVYSARVIAGPYGKVEQMNGKYRVTDGVNVISVNLENPEDFLDMQYVVRKIDENDEYIKDEYDLVITKKEVLGSLIE